MITIRPYRTTDQKAWDAYVMQHPEGTVFHLTKWKNVIEKTYGHKAYYLIAVNSSKLRIGKPDSAHSSWLIAQGSKPGGQRSENREQKIEDRNLKPATPALHRSRSGEAGERNPKLAIRNPKLLLAFYPFFK